MSYENPQVPHDVNVARGSHLLEFLRLGAGVALVFGMAAAVLYFAGGQLARFMPFSWERSWVGERVIGIEAVEPADAKADADAAQISEYLQRLTTQLAASMDLPNDMVVQTHYSSMAVPNAFATLGGPAIAAQGEAMDVDRVDRVMLENTRLRAQILQLKQRIAQLTGEA